METAPNLRSDAYAEPPRPTCYTGRPIQRLFLRTLSEQARPSPGAVLVDLACGPGRVVLDLANAFERALAIDLEPQMIEVGCAEAARRGIKNLSWRVGRAEDAAIVSDSVDLITIGEAFHRLDQKAVIGKAFQWLRPGGCIATLGTHDLLAGGEPWKEITAAVARRWMLKAHSARVAHGRAGAAIGPEAVARLLRESGFVDVESRSFVEPRDWSFEEIVGYIRSTSVCSERALGAALPKLKADLCAALGHAHGPPYHEQFSAGYTIGRKSR